MLDEKFVYMVLVTCAYGADISLKKLIEVVPSHRAKMIELLSNGYTVIVGDNTWNEISERLATKSNPKVVITKKQDFIANHPELRTAPSFKEAVQMAETPGVWVLGGFNVFQEAKKYTDIIHHTMVYYDDEKDTPKRSAIILPSSFRDRDKWQIIESKSADLSKIWKVDGKPKTDKCNSVHVVFRRRK